MFVLQKKADIDWASAIPDGIAGYNRELRRRLQETSYMDKPASTEAWAADLADRLAHRAAAVRLTKQADGILDTIKANWGKATGAGGLNLGPEAEQALRYGLIGAGGVGAAGMLTNALTARKKKPISSFLTGAALGGLGGAGIGWASKNTEIKNETQRRIAQALRDAPPPPTVGDEVTDFIGQTPEHVVNRGIELARNPTLAPVGSLLATDVATTGLMNRFSPARRTQRLQHGASTILPENLTAAGEAVHGQIGRSTAGRLSIPRAQALLRSGTSNIPAQSFEDVMNAAPRSWWGTGNVGGGPSTSGFLNIARRRLPWYAAATVLGGRGGFPAVQNYFTPSGQQNNAAP